MNRSGIAILLLLAGLGAAVAQTAQPSPPAANPPQPSPSVPSTPPMRFVWMREGPAEKCGDRCREWISASGQIQPNTARQFIEFMKARSVNGAVVVLDSSGGAVVGAMALGRLFRQLDITTTVGRTQKLAAAEDGSERATLSPQGLCASMCAFVVLGGKRRHVPPEARVLVHQIWPRSSRDDAAAATYSARDLVGIQRELGALAKYTIDMGGEIELFEIALRIPPWETLKPLGPIDIERLKLKTVEDPFNPAAQSVAATAPAAVVVPENRQLDVIDRAWAVNDAYGARAFSRRHPITIEGEQIGAFELSFVCGEAGVSAVYVEQRKLREAAPRDRVARVGIGAGKERGFLKVQTSAALTGSSDLRTVAQAPLPPDLLTVLADTAGQSLVIATQSEANVRTAIRPGNTGFGESFRQTIADCKK